MKMALLKPSSKVYCNEDSTVDCTGVPCEPYVKIHSYLIVMKTVQVYLVNLV